MANACDFFTDPRINPQLFIEFAAQRVPRLLAFFDLAAGKLPFQRHGLMPRPLAHQNFVILQNQSRNHAFHRRSYSRGKEKSFQDQAVDFSSCLPTPTWVLASWKICPACKSQPSYISACDREAVSRSPTYSLRLILRPE